VEPEVVARIQQKGFPERRPPVSIAGSFISSRITTPHAGSDPSRLRKTILLAGNLLGLLTEFTDLEEIVC
jgi:hypothetical protein